MVVPDSHAPPHDDGALASSSCPVSIELGDVDDVLKRRQWLDQQRWRLRRDGAGVSVFWGLIITAMASAVRQPGRHDRASGGVVAAHRTAQQMLAERFARGDIDETEFASRLTTLRDKSRL